MIYPTRRAVLIAAMLAPLMLVIGLVSPSYWYAGLALLAFFLALLAFDHLFGASGTGLELVCDSPGSVSVGAEADVEVHLRFRSSAPEVAEIALDAHPLLGASDGYRRKVKVRKLAGMAAFRFQALRRGAARIEHAWVRWRGLLGLTWRQQRLAIGHRLAITPDVRPVREKSAQLLHRDASHGLVPQLQVGEGAEFEALTDYRPGLDRRSIDWKQSARHTALIAKEYRTERNNQIVMAVDCGRAMSDPVAGLPRVDRAVSAALLTAFVALKDGDRVGFFSFDSHPRVSSKPVSGGRSFALLQRVAADIDYSERETNYTLGIATLATGLSRRSLIVLFTDFADTIGAELMLNALGVLLRRHLVLFVVLRDEELETIAAAEPQSAEDITRAVAAAGLLQQRRLVVSKLKRLGVHVIEARHEEAGPALLSAYLDLKRRSML